MRFFHNTPMAIATVDRAGRIVRTNPLFARLFHNVLSTEGGPARSVRLSPNAIGWPSKTPSWQRREAGRCRSGRCGAGGRRSSALGASRYPVEEAERDQEAAIVYTLETTAQRELESRLVQQQKME